MVSLDSDNSHSYRHHLEHVHTIGFPYTWHNATVIYINTTVQTQTQLELCAYKYTLLQLKSHHII